jgi:glycosyltransferase involved in cell wall biosynthesis
MASLAPTVTVIIPTYNSSRTLRLAIQSVLMQTLSDFEIWVVGDGCTDDSGEVVASFADHRLHWVNLPSNFGGPSVPRNEGWARANGRYIAYLGHDDLWFPWHLAEVVATLEREQAVFACSLGAVLEPGAAMAAFSLPHDPRRGGELSPSNWLHRCDLDQRIGRWSINSRWADDREFLRRVFEARVPIAFCRQLSVLKYPSTVWRLYDPGESCPRRAPSIGCAVTRGIFGTRFCSSWQPPSPTASSSGAQGCVELCGCCSRYWWVFGVLIVGQ